MLTLAPALPTAASGTAAPRSSLRRRPGPARAPQILRERAGPWSSWSGIEADTAVGVAAGATAVALLSGGTRRQQRRRTFASGSRTAATRVAVPGGSLGDVWADGVAPPSQQLFPWYDCWYPVHFIDAMDPTRPHRVSLLGLHLVIWNDGVTKDGSKQLGNWHVFQDSCPHRQGPLSEGRIEEDGNLLCSYHGWRFDGGGSCSDLPYSPPELRKKHMCNCRASCQVYPIKIVDSVLYVFPRSDPGASDAASAADVPLPSEMGPNGAEDGWTSRVAPAGIRDFRCSWDTMIDSLLRCNPCEHAADPARISASRDGFAYTGEFGRTEFCPPSLVKFYPDAPDGPFGGRVVVATHCIPTQPGGVRVISTLALRGGLSFTATPAAAALGFFLGPCPPWLKHALAPLATGPDSRILYPTRCLETAAAAGCGSGAAAFQSWLGSHAKGSIPWSCPDDALPLPESYDLLDTRDAHTEACHHCSVAYGNVKLMKYVSTATCCVALGFFPDGLERLGVAITTGLFAAALQALGSRFARSEEW